MWKYAAIVECVDSESLMIPTWYLVNPDGNDPLIVREWKDNSMEDEIIRYKWMSPGFWRYEYEQNIRSNYDSYVYHYIQENGEEPSPDHIKLEVENEKSEPEILYQSNDVLSLINIAGENGWELSGEITAGTTPSSGIHTPTNSWKTMRRKIG